MKEHTISIRLSEKTYSRLQNLADEYGLNMSSMLAYLVNERFLTAGFMPKVSDLPIEKPVAEIEKPVAGTAEYYAELAEVLSPELDDDFADQEPEVSAVELARSLAAGGHTGKTKKRKRH
jgi:hypothetical protein